MWKEVVANGTTMKKLFEKINFEEVSRRQQKINQHSKSCGTSSHMNNKYH